MSLFGENDVIVILNYVSCPYKVMKPPNLLLQITEP